MNLVIYLLSLILVLTCLLLGLLILLQLPKKEAGLGMAFGAGAVDTLLGAGAGNALTRITKWSAGIFLALCLALAWLYNSQVSSGARAKGVRDALNASAVKTPAAPSSSATPGLSSLVAPTVTNVPAAPTNAPALSTNLPVTPILKAATNVPAGK